MPRNGTVHHRLEPLSNARSAAGGLGDRAPGRPDHPLHGQDRDARLAVPRLAGDPIGRVFRPARRGDRAAQRFSSRRWPRVGRSASSRRDALADGHLKPVKSGAAFLAIRSGAPLLPVGIAARIGSSRVARGGRTRRDPHPDRRAVHAAASAGRPARPRGTGRRNRADHVGDRAAAARAQRRVR